MLRDVVKNNRIIITIDDFDLNIRRDEFYALMTWLFNSPSYTDFMDEYLFVTPINNTDPATPQDVRLVIQPMTANMMDDDGLEFISFLFDLFYVDVKMTADRRQVVKVFSKGMSGMLVKTDPNSGEREPTLPFLKELKEVEAFAGKPFDRVLEDFKRRNKFKRESKFETFPHKKDLTLHKTVADKLYEAISVMDQEEEANFFIEVLQKPFGQGKDISMTIRNIGVNMLLPVIFAMQKLTLMTEEMALNYLIRPSRLPLTSARQRLRVHERHHQHAARLRLPRHAQKPHPGRSHSRARAQLLDGQRVQRQR